MNNNTRLSLFLLVGLLFSSCYKEINLDKYRPEPSVVVSAVASTTDGIRAYVSRTWFYTDDRPDDLTNRNAKVELYINDAYIEDLIWYEKAEEDHPEVIYDEGFGSSVLPKEGDVVKIICKSAYGEASSELIVPGKPVITKVETRAVAESYYNYIYYKITMVDPPGPNDRYLIKIQTPTPKRYWDDYGGYYYYYGYSYIDYETEPLFTLHHSVLDQIIEESWIDSRGGVVFSDEAIDGQEYTLTIREYLYSNYYDPDDEPTENGLLNHEREIRLYKITDSFYSYYFSMQNMMYGTYYALNDLGFIEPMMIPNNIEGGVGIFGATNPLLVKVDIREYLEERSGEDEYY